MKIKVSKQNIDLNEVRITCLYFFLYKSPFLETDETDEAIGHCRHTGSFYTCLYNSHQILE